MCLDVAKRQRGFGMVAAIVILLMMAILGAFIVTLSTSQQHGSVLDVQGERAYAAAASGAEWGLGQAIANGNCTFGVVTLAQPINGMAVTVSGVVAAAGPAVEVGMGTICRITSTACNLPAANGSCPGVAAAAGYVERQVIALPE